MTGGDFPLVIPTREEGTHVVEQRNEGGEIAGCLPVSQSANKQASWQATSPHRIKDNIDTETL